MKKLVIMAFVISVGFATHAESGKPMSYVMRQEVKGSCGEEPADGVQIVSSGFGENPATACPRLQTIGDKLYASGPDGIMCRAKGEDAKWEQFAMQGVNVLDFRLSGDDILAIIVPDEYSDIHGMDLRTVARLVKGSVSANSIRDVTPSEMEYPSQGYVTTDLSAIAQHPTDNNSVMIMGHGGIMLSEDFGETWECLTWHNATYNPHSFLGWHPQNPEIIFLTSESAWFVSMVWRSTDSGKTWEEFSPEPNEETSCHYIAFDPDDADHLLVSGEYAVYASYDCGETWETVLDDDAPDPILGYAYNIMYDSTDPDNATVYAVGHLNGWPARNIVRSTDKGITWRQCLTYEIDEEENFFYDAALFDGKIWIYDHKDIVYWNIKDDTGIESPAIDNPRPAVYYDLNGIRLNSKPSSGVVIERNGQSLKLLVL